MSGTDMVCGAVRLTTKKLDEVGSPLSSFAMRCPAFTLHLPLPDDGGILYGGCTERRKQLNFSDFLFSRSNA
eukprot:10572-Rhodomonas_salina.1